jgi:tetratricopeptide (TPR) repeat protein
MTPPRPRAWLPLAAVGLLAFAVRLAHLWELDGSAVVSVLMGDSRQYDEWAVRIASGQWLGTEVFYQTPLYPYFLAVVYRIAGHEAAVARAVQAGVGAISCVLLGLAGRRFFSGRVGIVAASLLALYPPAVFFDGLIQKSSLDILFVALTLALLARFQDRLDWTSLAAAGVSAALLALNRENARVVYPVVVLWLLSGFRAVPVGRRAAWAAAFLGASFAVLLPVGLRNYAVGGEFLLSTSQLGPNLYIGNHARASGTYEPLVPGRGDAMFERADAMRLASEAAGRRLSPGEVSDYWVRRTVRDIAGQPARWAALVGKKLLLTVNADEIADTESIEAYADFSPLLRRLLWLDFGIVLPLAVFGAYATRADWRRLWLLYALFVGLALSVALFYVVARYRHPVVPLVLMFAAAGLVAIVEAVRVKRVRPVLAGVALAAVAAVVARLPIKVVHDETYLNLGSALLQAGRAAEAIPMLQRAASADAAYATPHYDLALAYQKTGRADAAIEELRAAIRLRPDYADAQGTLGLMLRDAGHQDEALLHFQEAARLAPASVEARTNLGLSLLEAGRTQEAIREHRAAVALAPDSPRPHNNLASALRQSGDVAQAIAEYRKALALRPEYAEAHANLALALADVQDVAGALTHFAEAARIRPDDYRLRMAYGSLLCDAGRLDEGVAQFAQAARLMPNQLDPLLLSARAYGAARRFGDAAASLEQALAVANAAGQTDVAHQIAASLQQARAMAARRGP